MYSKYSDQFRTYVQEILLLSISSFHLDHCGSLPWFLEKVSNHHNVLIHCDVWKQPVHLILC